MKKITVSVVIPVLNNRELLEQNLPDVVSALEVYGKGLTEIIASDDNSSDDSYAFLKEFQKKSNISMTVLEHKTDNRGFSINVNRGVKAAKGDIVILLGTDVRPAKDFIMPLVRHFEDEKIFAVGCVNKSDEDEGKDILRGRGIGRWKKGFLFHSNGKLINDDTLWVDCGSGAFRRKTWFEIGGLQELYIPFYWEDVDISYRAQKIGYKVVIEKNSHVIHEHKKGFIKKERATVIGPVAYRNQFYFVWLNITDINLLISHLLFIPYHLLVAIKGRNWNLLRGFIAAVSHFPKVIIERKKITSQFTVTDASILQRFKKEL